MMARPTVLISGIGIAGPTLAYWLDVHGFAPTLVEQSPHLRSGGYVMDFWGRGYDIAERMGLMSDLRREGYYVQELRFVDDGGRRVGGFPADIFGKATGGRFVTLRRSDLSRSIFRKIEGRCEAMFGNGVRAIEQHPDCVRIDFERGSSRNFDFVIGADGLHSAVRRLEFGPQDDFERYLGYVAAAFEVEGYRPRDDSAYVSYGVPGKQAARFAMRDDRTMFLFIFAAADPPAIAPHDRAAQKAMLRDTFGGAGWECRKMLAALDDSPDLYFDRVSQIRLERWTRGRVALVGDAAFCPSLLAGEGSVLAMTASYVLAGELAEAGNRPAPAFARYEAILRPLIERKQASAKRFASIFAPATRFGLFARNQISKLIRVPAIAKLVVGRALRDRLQLPEYAGSRSAPEG